MLNSGQIDKSSVDADQADPLLHLLDAVVIKLEGGTEEDLKILDVKPPSALLSKEALAIRKEKEEAKELKNKQAVEAKPESQ